MFRGRISSRRLLRDGEKPNNIAIGISNFSSLLRFLKAVNCPVIVSGGFCPCQVDHAKNTQFCQSLSNVGKSGIDLTKINDIGDDMVSEIIPVVPVPAKLSESFSN